MPDRVSGYRQTRKPLSYKPNCITESLMVYRKECAFLLDRNMKCYDDYDRHGDEPIDTTNCWHIAPKYDKNHPAVFPEGIMPESLALLFVRGGRGIRSFCGFGDFRKGCEENGKNSDSLRD